MEEKSMTPLTEKELFEIFRAAHRDLPEDALEFALILSGKCRIGHYTFPAPSLGTFLLLEEWKSPFVSGKATFSPGEGRRKILPEELFFALFLLENGREGALILMEERTRGFSRNGEKKPVRKRGETYRSAVENAARKYGRMNRKQAAKELEKILSLHTAMDMLPDETGEKDLLAAGREGTYLARMENVMGILCFAQEKFPSLTPEKILWDLPFALLGWLFVLEARKNGVTGIGRDETSKTIWERFSRHLSEEEKQGKSESEKTKVPQDAPSGGKQPSEEGVQPCSALPGNAPAANSVPPGNAVPRRAPAAKGVHSKVALPDRPPETKSVHSGTAVPRRGPVKEDILSRIAPVSGGTAGKSVPDRVSPEKVLGRFSRVLQEPAGKKGGMREDALSDGRIVSIVRQCMEEILPSDSV